MKRLGLNDEMVDVIGGDIEQGSNKLGSLLFLI